MRWPGSFLVALALLVSGCATPPAPPPDPLAGPQLYADLRHYASFGEHRFGSAADQATSDWLAAELRHAGLQTSFQPFTMDRQYQLDSASVTVGEAQLQARPFWWPPAEQASFRLSAPITPEGSADASGQIVWLTLPYDQSAYLGKAQRDAIAAAALRHPAAILLSIASPGEQPYAYNVAQADTPWPVPVLTVGTADAGLLRAAQAAGHKVNIAVDGRYEQQVAGRNVVARLDRHAARTIVVSTPTTGWFTSACERGSGIAVFLALARSVAASDLGVNFVFVATAGHEIGHGGMEVFLQREPPPADSVSWLHLGASLACYEWRKEGAQWVTDRAVDARRTLFYSAALAPAANAGSEGLLPLRRVQVGSAAPPGELREIHAAGYGRYLGLASGHRFFHNPGDTPATTGPEALAPVARALDRTLKLLARPE
ncbi:hypothetical protein LRH25_05475 [Ideonella azotifigens]|uniref:Uncharacterized protein n=2 Tax=Ideonella azotifigens TaxID=513160 RepID=A0ABP3UU59_9BURK|nr:hypothetical protein [Ideonella azotifigens]MCD2339790.1 hypothetical protein [Ideonella azotifigens]